MTCDRIKFKEVEGKVVLITGSTQGIGAAMAECFAANGAKVAINGPKMSEKAQAVIDRTGAYPAIGDLSDPAQAVRIVKKTEDKLGNIDVLVANAAGMTMKPFLEQDEEEWWHQVNINLTGHLACIQAALPGMKANRGGTIIIISSFFGTLGWKNASGYAASKSGLIALGQYIAREYEKDGINVGIIVPGVIDTPQLNVDAEDLGISLEEVHAMYAADIPMGRIGKPEEIAEMALFMSTNVGKCMSGRYIQVTGGNYRTTPYYI